MLIDQLQTSCTLNKKTSFLSRCKQLTLPHSPYYWVYTFTKYYPPYLQSATCIINNNKFSDILTMEHQ